MYLTKNTRLILASIADDPNFRDETDTEFEERLIEVDKKFAELDTKLPVSERIVRLKRSKEVIDYSNKAAEEIPDLIKLVDKAFPDPSPDFEQRLKKFGDFRKDKNG